MRLFISLHLNNTEQMHSVMEEASIELKPFIRKGNFTHTENFHVTLAFLGEVAEENLPSIKDMLSSVNGECFIVQTQGFDIFPKKRGDILFVKVETSVALQSLFENVVGLLDEIGFQIEKVYTPHITIGRNIRFTEGFSFELITKPVVELEVIGLDLMLSHRVNERLQHTSIFTTYFCEE